MLGSPKREQLEVLLVKDFIRNWCLNISIRKLEWDVCAYFINFFQLSNQLVLTTYFHQCGNLPDIQIHLTRFPLEKNTSRAHFSRLLSLIWISFIQISVILPIIAYFANTYQNLSGLWKGNLTILVTLLQLSY